MKDIILAGGSGAHLDPITLGTSKQLVPAYDKPMICYSLSTLMLARIQDVLVITTPHDAPSFHRLPGDGSQLGVNITYIAQETPNSLAQAFVLGTDHIGTDSAALVLGNSAFYGSGMDSQLHHHVSPDGGAVFAYHISGPSTCGVVEFDGNFTVLPVEEEPVKPKSHYVVLGLYFYDNNVVDIAKSLRPSARGEYKITDANRTYLKAGKLQVRVLSCNTVWFDTNTFDSLTNATALVHTVETRQGMKTGASGKVAWRMSFIGDENLRQRVEPLVGSGYGQYLFDLFARDDA